MRRIRCYEIEIREPFFNKAQKTMAMIEIIKKYDGDVMGTHKKLGKHYMKVIFRTEVARVKAICEMKYIGINNIKEIAYAIVDEGRVKPSWLKEEARNFKGGAKMSKELDLSIQGDTFADMKLDFDLVMNNLINSMIEKCAEEATLALKLGITLRQEEIPDKDGDREAVLPTFEHDIRSTMTVKEKLHGRAGQGMELMYDRANKKYVLRRIKDNQIYFDNNGNIIDPEGDAENARSTTETKDNPNERI